MISEPDDNEEVDEVDDAAHEDPIEEIDDLIREDPVMEFRLSDEEDEDENEKNKDSLLVPDVKVHTLIVNQDIDLHLPPGNSAKVTFSAIRPILKSPPKSPRSCRYT